MKKILMSLAVIAMAMLASCGGNDPKAINEKIQNGQELTMDDYTVMHEYVMEGSKEMAQVMQTAFTSEEEAADVDKKVDELKKKYPYVETFENAIVDASLEGKIDAATTQKWNEEVMELLK